MKYKERKYVQTSQLWFERLHCIKETCRQNNNGDTCFIFWKKQAVAVHIKGLQLNGAVFSTKNLEIN